MNPHVIDKRLVLRFENGQFSFRRINMGANYEQLFSLAKALNSFQDEVARQVLLVTATEFEA